MSAAKQFSDIINSKSFTKSIEAQTEFIREVQQATPEEWAIMEVGARQIVELATSETFDLLFQGPIEKAITNLSNHFEEALAPLTNYLTSLIDKILGSEGMKVLMLSLANIIIDFNTTLEAMGVWDDYEKSLESIHLALVGLNESLKALSLIIGEIKDLPERILKGLKKIFIDKPLSWIQDFIENISIW